MIGPNSVLDIARTALFASQAAIQVTGDNIANVNTLGYSRRSVNLEESYSIDYAPGQIGTGVRASEIVRHFDQYIENEYYRQSSLTERWDSLYSSLQGAESLVNESRGYGLSDSLSKFFSSWNSLTQRPDDYGTRNSLLGDSETLISTLKTADAQFEEMRQNVEDRITQEVTSANDLITQIADLNKQLQIHDVPGSNNANQLYDQRGILVRQLAEIIDINYIDNGSGQLIVTTKAGQTLVDGVTAFSLSFDAAQTFKNLTPTSTFDGNVYYDGSSAHEYLLQVTNAGMVSNAGAAAQFKVSLDNGKTWLTDDNGNVQTFYARPEGGKVRIGDLDIYFGSASDPQGTATQPLSAGDTFVIVPKKGLYWVQNTSTRENITPLLNSAGADDTSRTTGGTLAGLFNFRDQYLGEYQEKLDALTKGLIWEVNRRHSQGAGLVKLGSLEGTYSVKGDDLALGSNSSGLFFGDKLASGSSVVYIYNVSTGLMISNASGAVDWGAGAGIQNFNPGVQTLNSAATAFNRTFGTYLTATVVNHKLNIQVKDGYQFAFGTDTTGLFAALGLNTFFEGTAAQDVAISTRVSNNLDYLNAGHVNGAGENNPGDNTTATAIASLQTGKVSLTTLRDGTVSQSLIEYYDNLVGAVGSDTAKAKFNNAYSKTLAQDLNDRQQEISGVNLDEEMSNLIKYQHSYTAAAKLISTADQMLQTVLSLKP